MQRFAAVLVVALFVGCATQVDEFGDAAIGLSVEALVSPPDTACSFASYSGHDYWFCSGLRNWSSARGRCLTIGYDLATVESVSENQFLASRLLVNAWIGANDTATEGSWRWAWNNAQFWQGTAGGGVVGGAYRNWGLFEPNNTLNQDCAMFRGGLGFGTWSDETCASLANFVCEGDLCGTDPNKTEPGQCGCGIADTDTDGDGTANCVDGCSSDPNKATPGVCGCGVSDADGDGDGVLNCKDECPADATRDTAGDCGCANAPAAAGTACNDGLCPANNQCNGAGSCGNPGQCPAADGNCMLRTRAGKPYWFCQTARTMVDARQHCQAVGMDLATINDAGEDAFITAGITQLSFVGGSDQVTEGIWKWTNSSQTFWSGGIGGSAGGVYTNWSPLLQPAEFLGNLDCLSKNPFLGGAWESRVCTSPTAYVCERTCPAYDASNPVDGFCGILGCSACAAEQGDCSSDSQCADGLSCYDEMGPTFGLPDDFGVCLAACPGPSVLPNPNFCSPECPCDWFEGGCDADDDCVGDFVCVPNAGVVAGLPGDYGVCGNAPRLVGIRVDTEFGYGTFSTPFDPDSGFPNYGVTVSEFVTEIRIDVTHDLLLVPNITATPSATMQAVPFVPSIDIGGATAGYSVSVPLDTGNSNGVAIHVSDGVHSVDYYLYIYRSPVSGKTDCAYGSHDCTPCVNNVRAAYEAISETPNNIRYMSRGQSHLPPFNALLWNFGGSPNHIQSIARIPGVGGDADAHGIGPWFAFTRASPSVTGGGGLFLVHLEDLPTNGGEPIDIVSAGAWPPPERETRFYYPIGDVDHAGGMQLVGQVAAIASAYDSAEECVAAGICHATPADYADRLFIDFFDLSAPGSPDAFIQRFRVGDQGETSGAAGNPIPTISSVSVTRLTSGRFLMFVYGKDNMHEGWFYISDRAEIAPDTRWLFVQRVTLPAHFTNPTGFELDDFDAHTYSDDNYQNTILVTECGTGDLYIVGSSNSTFTIEDVVFSLYGDDVYGVDQLTLLKVDHAAGILSVNDIPGQTGPAAPGLREFNPGHGGYCTFRAGASIHVTPHHEMVLYCSTRKSNTSTDIGDWVTFDWSGDVDHTLKMAEFPSPSHE